MNLEIIGRIEQIVDSREGVSRTTGNKWTQQVVLVKVEELINNMVSTRDIVFEIWNGKCTIPAIGTQCKIKFNLESRKSPNGYWFTSATAWRIEPLVAQQPQQMQQSPLIQAAIAVNEPKQVQTQEQPDDKELPF